MVGAQTSKPREFSDLWKSVGLDSAIGKRTKRVIAYCHMMARRVIAMKGDLSDYRRTDDIRDIFLTLNECGKMIYLYKLASSS